MGECIIARSGAGGGSNISVATNLPILNENYPMDTQFNYTESGHTLFVLIDQYPLNCTYQWYRDNQPVIGETNSTYTFVPEDAYATYNIFCVVSNSLGSVSSRTASITVYPTKFYIIKNYLCDETKLGAYKLYSGSGSSMNEGYFQIWTNSTTSATFRQTSKAPTSRYNNVSMTYKLEDTDMNGKWILEAGNIVMYEFGYSSAVNNEYTNTLDISNVTTDEYIRLHVKSSDGNYTHIYIKELYLY